jgi:hypothetical protein
MIIDSLDGLLEEKESIDSQIAFCKNMAMTTAKNGDRDISQMYSHIAASLMQLTETSTNQYPQIDHAPRQPQDNQKRMDQRTEPDGQHAAGNGKGFGQPQEKECP